jgi:geranylgeranyl diphosphate synthase type II
MHALCLQPLLDNMRLLGLGKALRILHVVARMARESVEGQAVELDWVRRSEWRLGDRDYCRMSYKKTCWYTFIAPMEIGAIIAGVQPAQVKLLRKYATYIGIAFQIQDDALNLAADEQRYGKEIGGDLWEGKRTVMLLHMMRSASPDEQAFARLILEKPRTTKTAADVRYLYDLICRYDSIGYADELARSLATRAHELFQRTETWLPPSTHRDFLVGMADHVVARDK